MACALSKGKGSPALLANHRDIMLGNDNSKNFAPPVIIPKGASFKDMIALKGKSNIGDKINTQIIQ